MPLPSEDMLAEIDRRVPDGVREEVRQGLAAVEEGHGGDGLEASTIREARALAAGEQPGGAKMEKGFRFAARNARFADAEINSPAWVSWKLWGGDAGATWWARMWEDYLSLREERSLAEPQHVHERRFQIFAWGPVAHPNGSFVVDREFAERMLASFRTLASSGWRPSVLREHTPEGLTYGIVSGLEIEDDGIYARVMFPARMAEWFDQGFLDSWSPTFRPAFRHPHTGEVLHNVLRELSFVGVRHLKNIPGASAYYPLSEVAVSLAEAIEEADVEDMIKELLAAIAGLGEGQTALQQAIAAIREEIAAMGAAEAESEAEDAMPASEDGAEGADGAGEVERQLAEATQRIARLERERDQLRLRAELPGATDAEIVTLSEIAPAHREVVTSAIRARAQAERTAEVGTPGAPPLSGEAAEIKLEEAVKARKAEGMARGAGLLVSLSEDGYSTGAETIAIIEKVYGAR